MKITILSVALMSAADLSRCCRQSRRAALMAQIQAGGGKAMLKIVQDGDLTATQQRKITDAKGTVTRADVRQSNGVIHVIDTVLMPG